MAGHRGSSPVHKALYREHVLDSLPVLRYDPHRCTPKIFFLSALSTHFFKKIDFGSNGGGLLLWYLVGRSTRRNMRDLKFCASTEAHRHGDVDKEAKFFAALNSCFLWRFYLILDEFTIWLIIYRPRIGEDGVVLRCQVGRSRDEKKQKLLTWQHHHRKNRLVTMRYPVHPVSTWQKSHICLIFIQLSKPLLTPRHRVQSSQHHAIFRIFRYYQCRK